jgi:endonuclease/exonuclease/phosphatase (EEP) superfamily protein YafD
MTELDEQEEWADEEQAPERKPRNRAVTFLLVLCTLAFAALVFLRLTGIDGDEYTITALALTPYVTAAGGVLAFLALLLRRWRTGLAVLVIVAALMANLLPRVNPDEQPKPPRSLPLRVMTANLYFGQGDAATVVNLVRSNQVQLLNLQELTPEAAAALDRAGLFTLLPNRVLHSEPGGAGSGIVSRFPLTEIALAARSPLWQPSARVDLGDGRAVEDVLVHPVPPTSSAPAWKSALQALPPATADLPARLLIGDFNATLDHDTFRSVLGNGYADAADRLGKGLTPTWPHGKFVPLVTLDHVLADDRTQFTDYRVVEVPGSDHSAVIATLNVPV